MSHHYEKWESYIYLYCKKKNWPFSSITNNFLYMGVIISVLHWQWSETPSNYVGPPEHSYPVVRWTTKISNPNQIIVTCSKNLNNRRHSRAIIHVTTETLYHSRLFQGTKHVFVIMSSMNSWGRKQSSSMLWFYKINDGNTSRTWKNLVQDLQVCCQNH